MRASLTPSAVSASFPHVSRLMSDREIAERIEELERLGIEQIHQIDRDLEFLTRHVPEEKVSVAYRDVLRNPGGLVAALYEVRAAAMLAGMAREIELEPLADSRRSGDRGQRRRADIMCLMGSHRIFVEVTTYVDTWPPAHRGEIVWYGRATVERSFNPMPRSDDPRDRDISASKEFRDRIERKVRQLPEGEFGLVVLGAPNASSHDIEAALFGDEHYDAAPGGDFEFGRFRNGLFAVPDEIGGVSRIGGLVWLKLLPVWSGVRVHARLFCNPRAARPFPAEVESALLRVFDRRAVLWGELERIKRILIDQYGAKRIILFGSLAADRRQPGDWIHQWSDIDLVVVADTGSRFSERTGEVMRLIRPRVGLNVLVYTPEEFERAEREGGFFVRDEILERGYQLYP